MSKNQPVYGPRLDETGCKTFCQHPACWASVNRQEKGVPRVLSPLDIGSDSSDDELNLPTQSVCNLLSDYGESNSDRYPLSTGGRPSHQWETSSWGSSRNGRSVERSNMLNIGAPHNTTVSFMSRKATAPVRNSRLRLVEVQEVFDREDLNSQWDETFITKQYYVWVPNPNQKRSKKDKRHSNATQPTLMKDMTECMIPPEIEQKREETILFDEWPVLKKKQKRTLSPSSKSVTYQRSGTSPNARESVISVDTEGINELLALPRDTLMKVLEQTKRSDFTSKGKIHSIVEDCIRDDEQARIALSARELFKQQRMPLLSDPARNTRQTHLLHSRPVFQLDDDGIIDRLSSVNTPVKGKEPFSDAGSIESFPRYKRPLPGISGDDNKSHMNLNKSSNFAVGRAKIPAISLGLPELPSGIRTTRTFTYNKKDVDFSLGPVISPPSTVRSAASADYSEHGTTIKVHAPSSHTFGKGDVGDQAIHSVSPALSTHVPLAPAGTPANNISPTKSAPVFRDYSDIARDPTQVTMGTSIRAQPASREAREETFLTSPSHVQIRHITSPLHIGTDTAMEERGLDTINETAREMQESAMNTARQEQQPDNAAEAATPRSQRQQQQDAPQAPTLHLETSTLRSIDAAASPKEKSARSIESCPSPDQWPLISEASFEQMMPRPSISEPALSARSDRRRPISRGREENGMKGQERDYARKVMDDKLKAESPAPPPPSPEPKDPNDKTEYRSRKDLKSRESLSMAPLFEVSEMEETSPVKELLKDDEQTNKNNTHQERSNVRKIVANVPYGKNETEKTEEVDEMVSQITVMHVTPKGRDPKAKKGEADKVQETFLNVDIPAEEISSLKAEHGSSHQEDISSNDTVVKSESSKSEASLTPRVQGSEVKEETSDVKEEEKPEVLDRKEDQTQTPREEKQVENNLKNLNLEGEQGDVGEAEPQSLAQVMSDISGESPEMMCDSARFISHDMVSPVEGEEDRPLVLPGEETMTIQEAGEKEAEAEAQIKAPDEERETVEGTAQSDGASEAVREEGEGQGEAVREDNPGEGKGGANGDEESPELEEPGSFFFNKSLSSSEEAGDEKKAEQKENTGEEAETGGEAKEENDSAKPSDVGTKAIDASENLKPDIDTKLDLSETNETQEESGEVKEDKMENKVDSENGQMTEVDKTLAESNNDAAEAAPDTTDSALLDGPKDSDAKDAGNVTTGNESHALGEEEKNDEEEQNKMEEEAVPGEIQPEDSMVAESASSEEKKEEDKDASMELMEREEPEGGF